MTKDSFDGEAKQSRATKIEKMERVRIIYRMKLIGTPSSTICEVLKKEYGLGARQIKHYISEAKVLLNDLAQDILHQDRLDLLRLEDLYREAIANKKYDLALKILAQLKNLRDRINAQEITLQSKHTSANIPDALVGLYEEDEETESDDTT